ncbi:unnamed protein product [Closterium sp. Yama58-4]|nr:unnamed protein product [Closterium sp. Yama58-4]
MIGGGGEAAESWYKIKRVSFLGRQQVPIVMQNDNGPCPLLGIANVLLLRNAISLRPSATEISQSDLLSLVAHRLLDSNTGMEGRSAEYISNRQQNVADCMALLPRLATGIDVNVRFTGIHAFEFTPETAIFDLLDISLVHGWLVDAQDSATAAAVGSLSYNSIVERLGGGAASVPERPAEEKARDEEEQGRKGEEGQGRKGEEGQGRKGEEGQGREDKEGGGEGEEERRREERGNGDQKEKAGGGEMRDDVREALLLFTFLNETASQLTYHGLFSLQEGVKENQLCVFFRNNHFSTLFKRTNHIYLLVTDQGYLNQPGVVWERLGQVEGDTTLCEADFTPFAPPPSLAHMGEGGAAAAQWTHEDDAAIAAAAAAVSDRCML